MRPQTGCRLYPLCVDSSVCRGDCVRYMRATARDRNARQGADRGHEKQKLPPEGGRRSVYT